MSVTQRRAHGVEQLTKDVRRTTLIALGVSAISVLAYFGHFYLWLGREASGDPEQWGQFGDYVGGMLNPLIALLAFYWLTRSVLLQKEEMQRTTDALLDSARHQEAMANQAERAARINALAAILASTDAEIAYSREKKARMEGDFVAHARTIGPDGKYIGKGSEAANSIFTQINKRLEVGIGKRQQIEDDLQKLVSATDSALA